MKRSLKIALVGDYNPSVIAHDAISKAIELAAKAIQVDVKISWVPSVSLEFTALELLDYQGIWCVPGSPYKSMTGVLRAITFAREVQILFWGLVGDFSMF